VLGFARHWQRFGSANDPFVCEQFGAFPIGGIGGFAPGSTGIGLGGIRGGLIGGSGGGAAAGSIGPLLTLEAVFGTGFTAQSIADAILVQEQGESSSTFSGGLVIVTRGLPSETGAAGMLIFTTITGIFQILGANGSVQGSGRTPDEAAQDLPPGKTLATFGLDPVLSQQPSFAEPSAVIPGPAEGGEFGELLRTILGALGQLRGGRGRPSGLEPVAIGGTVNVPVVLGSTSDPRGTLRPTAAAFVPKPPPPPPRAPERPTATQASANIIRVIIDLLLQRRQQQALRDAQRRQLELFAAAAALRRQAVGFGQAGFVGTTSVGPFIGGALGGLAGDAIEGLLERLFRDTPDATRLPAFPPAPQLPGQQPTGFPSVPGLDLSVLGGGGGCPPLFRTGTGAMRVSPTPWFPVQAPDGKWFFFGHLGKPTFSKLKSPRRHHHHPRKR